MKNLLIGIIVILIFGCNETKEETKVVKIVDEVVKLEPPKDTILISKKDYLEIQGLSQAAKDVAIYFITHKEEWTANNFTFGCGKYKIWIANDYSFLKVYKPVRYQFNKKEKDFFWKMYKTYQRKDMRLYEYENKIEIILGKQ